MNDGEKSDSKQRSKGSELLLCGTLLLLLVIILEGCGTSPVLVNQCGAIVPTLDPIATESGGTVFSRSDSIALFNYITELELCAEGL